MMHSTIAVGLLCIFATAQLGVRVSKESGSADPLLCGDIDYAEIEVFNTGQQTEHFELGYIVNVEMRIRKVELKTEIYISGFEGELLRKNAPSLRPNASALEFVLLPPWLQLQDPVFDVDGLQTISQAAADSNLPQHDLDFEYGFRIFTNVYAGERFQPAKTHEIRGGSKIKGYVLLKKPRVEYLYFSPLDVEINKEYDYNGRLGPQYKQARSGGATQYERMMPVDWNFFGVRLNNFYRVPEHFDELVTQLNPQSRLYRLCKLIHMANDWVQTPDGDERTRKEQLMLGYASQGGHIESKYLTTKIEKLIATKALECGDYVAPNR